METACQEFILLDNRSIIKFLPIIHRVRDQTNNDLDAEMLVKTDSPSTVKCLTNGEI